MSDDYFGGFGGGDDLRNALRLAMAPNRLAGGQMDTQDVIGAIPKPPPSAGLLEALRDRAMRGDAGAAGLVSQHDQAKSNVPWFSSEGLAASKPNALGTALSNVPSEIMTLANFLGPRVGRLPAPARAPEFGGKPSIVEEVPSTQRWETRASPDQRAVEQAKASGLWPDWGDTHPARAIASVKEQMARHEWDAVVNPIMYPNGLRAMPRDAAEAIAMQTHPERGLKYQDARRAWLEFDKQRPLTPGEEMWEGLDRAPGVEPPSAADLMDVYGRERFMTMGRPSQTPKKLK